MRMMFARIIYSRIDFRELVRDLFAIYKTRIWLQQVVPSGKKAGNELEIN